MNLKLFITIFLLSCLPLNAQTDTEEKEAQGQSDGPAVDRQGAPVVDPTKNVLDLFLAAQKREDDLRKAGDKLLNSELRRLDDLRTQYEKMEILIRESEDKRLDQRYAAESRRVDEQATLRASYGKELIDAEAKRIDAIRRVDVEAVQVASERATQQASVLASQVTASADTLRALVATTAQTFAQQQQLLQTQITERLSQLEKGSYQTSGRASVADPALEQLTLLVRKLETAQSVGQGGEQKSSALFNSGNVILMAGVGVVGILISIIGAVIAIVSSRRKTLT